MNMANFSVNNLMKFCAGKTNQASQCQPVSFGMNQYSKMDVFKKEQIDPDKLRTSPPDGSH